MDIILKSVASGLVTYSTHYGATKFYTHVCVPDGMWGYITGLISIGSPICQASIKVIDNTQVSYTSLLMMGITRIIIDFVAPNIVK